MNLIQGSKQLLKIVLSNAGVNVYTIVPIAMEKFFNGCATWI